MSIIRQLRGSPDLVGNIPAAHPFDTPDVGSAQRFPKGLCEFGFLIEPVNVNVPAGDTFVFEYYFETSDTAAANGDWIEIGDGASCPYQCVVIDNEQGATAITGADPSFFIEIECHNEVREYVRIVATYRSALGGSVVNSATRNIAIGVGNTNSKQV